MASQYEVGAAPPCADVALLVPLKRSPEYRAIRRRVASPRPLDSWFDRELHFFVFQLQAVNGNGSGVSPVEPPVAVFTMHPEAPEPISAVMITPSPNGAEAEVTDLRVPERVYSAPLSSPALSPQAPTPGDLAYLSLP
jgi:hypothetical protein